MNRIVLAGLSHRTAPVAVRERCRVEDLGEALGELKATWDEAVILSTCNRFEVYAVGTGEPRSLLEWLAKRSGVSAPQLDGSVYLRQGRNAAKHLFFVASSLDSLVLGETQIRAQVKDAYAACADAGGVGTLLHRLFQAALRVSKEIAESTGVGRGNVSVAGAAADLAGQVFGDLSKASALVVGAGETAELVVRHLGSRGVERFWVVNRTLEAAEALAAACGGKAAGLDALGECLPEADVLVAAAGASEPLVSAAAVRSALRRRRGRPMVLLDIAVPRGVDPQVGSLDNVYRYDMDALTAVTTDALRHRRKDFLQCCTMIDAAALRLEVETRAGKAGSAIAELEREYQEMGAATLAELERRLPGLSEEEWRQVRRAIHRLVHKFLHMPVRSLREGDPERSEAVKRAFSVPRRRDG